MPLTADLPPENTDPWYSSLSSAWTALKAFVNGLETSISDLVSTVQSGRLSDAALNTKIINVTSGSAEFEEAVILAVTNLGGAGILTFPEGADTSAVPEGAVFGIYTPPPSELVMPTYVGDVSAASDSAVQLTLDPAAPAHGTGPATGDWVIAILGINAPGAGETFPVPEGWISVREDYSLIGTMRTRIFARERQPGDGAYTFPTSAGAANRALNATLIWVRGAAGRLDWIVGEGKSRTDAPSETTTTTGKPITTSAPETLVLTISLERTTAAETAVAFAGATQRLFVQQAGTAVITAAVGSKEMPLPGATDPVTVTYQNSQATNAYAFQLGIPAAG